MRRLAIFALSFGAADLLACYLVPLHWLAWLGLGCAAGGLALLPVKRELARRGVLLLLGLAAGFLWFRGWTALFLRPVEELAGYTGTAPAVVTGYPEETDYGVRLEVRVEMGAGVSALVYAGEDWASLEPGDRLELTARFEQADRLRGEKVAWYTSKGIFLLAYADGEAAASRPARVPIRSLPARWARVLRESIERVFPADVSGLAQAVILGGRDSLSDWDSSMLTRAGLSHVVAVSGMHIGILTQGLLALCRRRRRLAAALTIPALILFALMVGAGPGVVRAVVMQIILLLAPVLGREADGPTSLGAALLLLLAVNPCAAASISLQLSFGAVAGILLVSDPLRKWMYALFSPKERGRGGRALRAGKNFLCTAVATSLGATLFTAPLSAIHFGTVSLVGVLSNFLALWAVFVLFLLGLLAGIAGLVLPLLGSAVARVAAVAGRWVLGTGRVLGGLACAGITMDFVYYRVWLAALYLLLGGMLLFGRRRPRPVLPVCCAVTLLCAAVCFTRTAYAAAALTVSALDVGQGSATAIISRGAAALVDCGGNGMDNAGDIVADHFQAMGISRLDLLVLTHFDGDHCNGVEELFRRMEVAAVAVPDIDDQSGRKSAVLDWAAEEGARVYCVDELSGAVLGEAELTLFPPLGTGSSNETGLCILCSVGDDDVLITGDADRLIETMLVKYFPIPDVELLIVGHHGSRFSTSEDFLAAVRPEMAVISCGYNTYGHPAPETLARLEQAGASVYRTDLQGTVTAVINGGG